jgi:hypothetical protein
MAFASLARKPIMVRKPGTKRLFTDHQFYTKNKRAKIHAVTTKIRRNSRTRISRSFSPPAGFATSGIR